MWYVIWTSTGLEGKALAAVRDLNCQNRSFIPRRAIQIKKNGIWERVEKPLFPGYFFVDTDDVEKLSDEVRKIEGFNQILTTEKEFFPLEQKDATFIDKLYNREGLFDVSEGIIEGDQIVITSGPLKGQEGSIRKIDRHKRLAYLEFTMFDQVVKVSVGLEIVEKR